MDIELTSEDFSLLKRVLERYRSDLRAELAGTDNYEWRKEMHADEDRLNALLAQLERANEVEDGGSELVIVVRGFVVAAP